MQLRFFYCNHYFLFVCFPFIYFFKHNELFFTYVLCQSCYQTQMSFMDLNIYLLIILICVIISYIYIQAAVWGTTLLPNWMFSIWLLCSVSVVFVFKTKGQKKISWRWDLVVIVYFEIDSYLFYQTFSMTCIASLR